MSAESQYQPRDVEERMLAFWEREATFAKLREARADEPEFRFLDGPITANNPMGVHHAWGRTLKDVVLRYQAMQGHSGPYVNGFDCQGLWVEVEVERELGFRGKPDIEAFGLAEFSRACRDRVNRFAAKITEQSIRLGMWMRWDHSYYTHDDHNITAIWHFLKTCHEHGHLYRGHMPLPWCTRCGTSLSQHEMQGSYVRATQPAIYVTMPLLDDTGRSLVIWTTTPWTLAANTGVAVNPDVTYEEVRSEHGVLVLAPAGRRRLGFDDDAVVGQVSGRELDGLRVTATLPDLPVQQDVEHRVVLWDGVEAEEGTGVLHLAPGCGPEDFELARSEGLAVIGPVDQTGHYVDGLGWLAGRDATQVTDDILARLRENGRLVHDELYEHSVQICWRCKSHVIFLLVNEWFLAVEHLRQPMIEAAASVRWRPEHIGKRMEDWLRNMGDWCISRKRYWGLPLPFYRCAECESLTVVGSLSELRERALEPTVVDGLPELHRPWIDEVRISCPDCGAPVERVPEVGDCWLDAGVTPFSTLGYFDDREAWRARFPVDWVSEMREQTTLWFYSMLFVSVVLEGRSPYDEVLSYERVISENGEPFSKSGYMIHFDEAVERFGADPLRYLFCRQSVANECRFGPGLAAEARKHISSLWNIHAFLMTYAPIDRPSVHEPDELRDTLSVTDRWLMARTEAMLDAVEGPMREYNTPIVLREVEQYLDEVSNWYVRVNRRRFWRAQSDDDKLAAYASLVAALRTATLVLAPIVPFVTEQIWQTSIRPLLPSAPESVHLERWPASRPQWRDAGLLERTAVVRGVIRSGLRLREAARLRLRQPLRALYVADEPELRTALESQLDIVADELNVKRVDLVADWDVAEEVVLAVDFRRAGPVLRDQVATLARHVEDIPADERATVQAAIGRGEAVRLSGWDVDLPPEIFKLDRRPRDDFLIDSEGRDRPLIALDARLDEALIDEGTARDLVRHIQVLRRDAGLEVTSRIVVSVDTEDDAVRRAVARFEHTIASEVLADRLRSGLTAPMEKIVDLRGASVRIALKAA